MWQVIAGRVVSAVGAAGMVVIVSVLITGKPSSSPKARSLFEILSQAEWYNRSETQLFLFSDEDA